MSLCDRLRGWYVRVRNSDMNPPPHPVIDPNIPHIRDKPDQQLSGMELSPIDRMLQVARIARPPSLSPTW